MKVCSKWQSSHVQTSSKKRIKAAIRTCEKGFSVVRVCRAVGIPRSTFYASQKQTEAQQREAKLAQTVEGIQIKHYFTIGRRRMGKLVAEELGFEPCECTLQRVMKEYGLNAQIRRVRKVKPHAGKAYQAQLPDNTLNREFRAEQPLHRMVTDVTYIPYYENNEWHWGFCLCYKIYLIALLWRGVLRKSRITTWGSLHCVFWPLEDWLLEQHCTAIEEVFTRQRCFAICSLICA